MRGRVPDAVLLEIVARYGHEIGDDPKRCEALLRDLCEPGHQREVFALVNAARDGVPSRLRRRTAELPLAVLLAQSTEQLHANLGIVEDLAAWAVNSWALALGLMQAPRTPPVRDSGGHPPLPDTPPPDVQFMLGLAYAEGRGVGRNDVQAVACYRMAADQGLARAQTKLGFMYQEGRGVPQSDAEAVAWYRRAAEQGLAEAQAKLGAMYANGRGVPRDEAWSSAWYQKAAAQGHVQALEYLNCSQQSGLGTTRDNSKYDSSKPRGGDGTFRDVVAAAPVPTSEGLLQDFFDPAAADAAVGGQVRPVADGQMSTDDGATEAPLSFSDVLNAATEGSTFRSRLTAPLSTVEVGVLLLLAAVVLAVLVWL